MRRALLAVDEINANGGVLGRLSLLNLNSGWRADQARKNVDLLADKGAQMVMGSASSEEAVAAGMQAKSRAIPYFLPLAYAS